MAFKQYTRCIQPSQYIPFSRAILITVQGLLVGGTAALLALGYKHPVCLWIALEITVLAGVVAYCRNWLYHRLICLGGDRDVIGVVVSIEPPAPALFDFDWDTDYSINLLLENTEFGVLQEQAQLSSPYGYLIHPQDAIKALGLDTPGYDTLDAATNKRSAVLHAEFEGAGNYDLLLGAEAGLGLAIAALVACIALPPPWGLILALAGLLALILGGLFGNSDTGSPSDAGSGGLHTNTESNDGYGSGADVVYVQGTWVYDPLHKGWNEIHPVKVCTKIGCWKGDWFNYECKDGDGATPPDIILRLRDAFQVAQAEETQANQARAEHQWRLHPDLDGCARDVIE